MLREPLQSYVLEQTEVMLKMGSIAPFTSILFHDFLFKGSINMKEPFVNNLL